MQYGCVDAERDQTLADAIAQENADRDVGESDVSVRIARDVFQTLERVFRNAFNDALGHNRDAVVAALRAPFDDRAGKHVDDGFKRERVAGKLLGNNRKRCTGGIGHTERQRAGFTSHAHDDVPADGRARVFEQALDDLRPDRARRFEANVGALSGRGRSLSIVFGTVAMPMTPLVFSAMRAAPNVVSSPPMQIK